MSFVQGFGGMRVINDHLHFAPMLPEKWEGYSFRINFRNATIKIEVNRNGIVFENHSAHKIELSVYGSDLVIPAQGQIIKELNSQKDAKYV